MPHQGQDPTFPLVWSGSDVKTDDAVYALRGIKSFISHVLKLWGESKVDTQCWLKMACVFLSLGGGSRVSVPICKPGFSGSKFLQVQKEWLLGLSYSNGRQEGKREGWGLKAVLSQTLKMQSDSWLHGQKYINRHFTKRNLTGQQ